MATLTVTSVTKAGIARSLAAAAAGGDEFANNGQTLFVAANGSGGALTLTFVTQATTDGLAVADRTVSVGAGGTEYISDLDPDVYNVASTGRVRVTYSGVGSLTVGAFQMNKTW